ncbi:MAG: hypothetical protein F6K54_34675 [Okeania sp. SIO3B5]|uniref:hypothetical protein n=1 Tax=Okeania sp. SIO3B5 TaxID=2607811 RepID=UPI0013FFDDD0|nr:hypothetical protein [Okeania sp. SIO3B5]NEO57759.1 hypothetical protein [Okeania sp. SIO3B5]
MLELINLYSANPLWLNILPMLLKIYVMETEGSFFTIQPVVKSFGKMLLDISRKEAVGGNN